MRASSSSVEIASASISCSLRLSKVRTGVGLLPGRATHAMAALYGAAARAAGQVAVGRAGVLLAGLLLLQGQFRVHPRQGGAQAVDGGAAAGLDRFLRR